VRPESRCRGILNAEEMQFLYKIPAAVIVYMISWGEQERASVSAQVRWRGGSMAVIASSSAALR